MDTCLEQSRGDDWVERRAFWCIAHFDMSKIGTCSVDLVI